MNHITLHIVNEGKVFNVLMYEDDTWGSLCDKISAIVLRDGNVSNDTGHYNHDLYYVTYIPMGYKYPRVGKCYNDGMPWGEINPDHILRFHLTLKKTNMCSCFVSQ